MGTQTLALRRYIAGTDLASLPVRWRDENRRIIPFVSDAHAFALRVSRMSAPDVALVVKTLGFAVYDTAPNLVVNWATSGELHDLPVGLYLAIISAKRVSDGRTRAQRFQLQILRGTPAPGLAPQVPAPASDAWLRQWAADPVSLMFGTITRDGNGVVTTADVVWPDGVEGTYTATGVTAGGYGGYAVTYGPRTVTQPPVTRDGSGLIIIRPALTVA